MASPEPKKRRPTRLTLDLQNRIVGLINAGSFPIVAAAACRVSEGVFLEWMARGRGTHERQATELYVGFAEAIEEARAKAELAYVLKLREYIEGSRPDPDNKGERIKTKIKQSQVVAAQWMLSRGFSQRWGGKPDVSIAVTATVSLDEVEKRVADARAAMEKNNAPDE